MHGAVDYVASEINKDYAHAKWFGTDLQFTKQLFEKHKLVWGVVYEKDWKQDQGNYDVDDFVYLDDERESEWWGAYVQDEFKILENLILNAGIRYDKFGTFDGTTNPRLALIYSHSQDTVLKLLYGTAFRAPSAYEVYYHDQGTTRNKASNLKPEEIKTYEVVLEQTLNKNLKANISGFMYTIENLISDVDVGGGILQFQNSDKVKAKGLEVELDGKWENGWQSRISYAFVETEDTGSDTSLTNSPRHLGKANLIVPLMKDKLFAGIEGQYESKRKTLGGNHTDDFIIVNLTLTYTDILKNLDVSFSIYNVFDKKYGNPGFGEHTQDIINQDGRTIGVKLTYRF